MKKGLLFFATLLSLGIGSTNLGYSYTPPFCLKHPFYKSCYSFHYLKATNPKQLCEIFKANKKNNFPIITELSYRDLVKLNNLCELQQVETNAQPPLKLSKGPWFADN